MAYKIKKRVKRIFPKKLNWRARAYEIEANGEVLEEYLTDDFDGSNTGDGILYYYKGGIFEITNEIGGAGMHFGEITDKEQIEAIKERHKIK